MKIQWQTYAGGTSAHRGNSYDARGEFGEYHIWPPQSRFGSYTLKWANTKGKKAPHGGLWHELGSFRSPLEAKRAAKEHALSIVSERDRRRRSSRDTHSRATAARDPKVKGWALWSMGDRYEEPQLIEVFADKGAARARARRLQAGQRRAGMRPYRYTIKPARVTRGRLFERRR